MADIKSDAKKEFLGQPLWVWGVAGAVMIAAAIYLYRRNAKNQAAAAGAGGGQTPDGSTTAADAGVSTFSGWVADQQSSPGGTTTTTTSTVQVPNVVGQRATPGIARVRAAGFRTHTSPQRNPARAYTISGQSPGGGKQAPVGSLVELTLRTGT